MPGRFAAARCGSPASGRRYRIAKASGHSAFEADNVDALVRATDGFD
ncbi:MULTISPECIES: hypothetical protein [Stenotrophomonas]|nr:MULTISPECIES: hypothetical protein [unclassified Stenotrophomonas]MCI1051854.1 hypothetical protein [Stenotrophomonas maltophilia]MCU1060673.1 hypothetical protein [Stenotrophomonas maltophilia]UXB32940.1 hypothetical protein K7564_03625 [Stenotrophomonas maltophilia]WNB78594.1 hypothetical protein Q9R16_12155 [Stenotrophomonas sp. 9]